MILKYVAAGSIVLNIVFFIGFQSLTLKPLNLSSNGNKYTNNHNYKCHNGFEIGGISPICLDYVQLSNYNSSNKLRAAVVCLAYGKYLYVSECFEELLGVAKLFSDTIMDINDMNISFILFRGPYSLNSEQMLELHNEWKATNFNVNFTNNFVIRTILIDAPNMTKQTSSCPGIDNINYLHMNAFRVKYQFIDDYIINSNFSYLWQLDSNLKVKSMPCNPFSVMIRTNALLGYWNGGVDLEMCRHNFTDVVLEYASNHNLLSQGTSLSESFSFSGGSLIFDIRFFQSISYKHFIEMVMQSGLIYSTRLGDQVIYHYALAIMAPFTDNIHLFSGWLLCHHNSYGGCDVYTDKWAPLWHINEQDPFCVNNKNQDKKIKNHQFNIKQMSIYLENKWRKRQTDNNKLIKIYRNGN